MRTSRKALHQGLREGMAGSRQDRLLQDAAVSLQCQDTDLAVNLELLDERRFANGVVHLRHHAKS